MSVETADVGKKVISDLIHNFSIENLLRLIDLKIGSYKQTREPYRLPDQMQSKFKNYFETIEQITKAKIPYSSNNAYNVDFRVFAVKTSKELKERNSKKNQFEVAKTILKQLFIDAGIFVFYDDNGNFRFSLVFSDITPEARRVYSNFKRYTFFVEKHKPNRTFYKQILESSFDNLESIKEAFSRQPLTKEFYSKIEHWYAWALKDNMSWFPDGKKEENLIRLITRLVFVWFLKERGLIPECLFSEEKLKDIVKDFGNGNYFYNAVLQNLFFATLNQPSHKRGWADNNQNDKALFRYQDFLKIDKIEFQQLFKDIPFINGGLFECLDKESKYIDGFSSIEEKRTKILDELFFGKEREEDLSNFYGGNKIEKVQGLINILNDFNWTADESSSIDIDVSLDPELLGHIFENLLASYNEETKATARKSTGSYYTPKEIVDFMVEESLIEYFKSKTQIDEETLRDLIQTDKEVFITDDEEITDPSNSCQGNDTITLRSQDALSIATAVNEIKILDPSVGSGAFPMGILHKLVNLLSKIDQDNRLWYEIQYNNTLKEIEDILKIQDKQKRGDKLKEINELFDENINYPDYARKLYIIENSIYGVDIQNIAIQISKLRFFLSLLIDQRINPSRDNFGIKPLPHLETKFVCANTLIGLNNQPQKRISEIYLKHLKQELKKLYHKYFTIKFRSEKEEIEQKANQIRTKLKTLLLDNGFPNEDAEQITSFNIFDQTAEPAEWFDPEWMFGVEKGFDIIIGNPPYGNLLKEEEKKYVNNHYLYSTTSDISSTFIERGISLLKPQGQLFYIITFAITFNKKFYKNRKQMNEAFLKTIIYTFDRDRCGFFENMSQSVSILMCITKDNEEKQGIFTSRMFRSMPELNRLTIEVSNCRDHLLPIGASFNHEHRLPKIGETINSEILKILKKNPIQIKTIISEKENANSKKIWIRTSGNYWYNAWDKKPYEGSEIKAIFIEQPYYNFLLILMNSSLFYFWFRVYGDGRHMNHDIFEEIPIPQKEKILKYDLLLSKASQRFLNSLWGVFDEQHNRFLSSKIKHEIDLLDLVLGRYLYNLTYDKILHIMNYDFEVRGGIKLKEYEEVALKILNFTQSDDYEANQTKQNKVKELEKQIDQLVYKLYNLTEEEI
ncbi:MAG TPA: SAM-dependent DNA methyltransferase, partial [Thermodesulfobium narugense]|nr:SAM-dependent DNA methyltransferase [Thermodesulfobium narugense]